MAAAGGTTSLWWDMESCPLPSYVDPYSVVSMAPALLRNFNIISSMGNAGGGCSSPHHYHFSAYEFFSETQTELHQTLINSGIRLHQLAHGKTRNEMEKMMMADVLLWAMDTPPPANIIFMIGSVDFCYVFQKLRQRSYNVFLICQSMSKMSQGMLCGVNYCLGWLSFLRSLQNEDQQSHFPKPNEQKNPMASPGGWNPYPNQKLKSKGKPRAETDPKASKDVLRENPYPNQKIKSEGEPRAETDPKASKDVLRENPYPNQKIKSEGEPRAETNPKDLIDVLRKFMYYMPGPQGFLMTPLAKRIEQHTGTFPKFPNSTQSKKTRSPGSSASSTEKIKLASLEEFKAWLTLVVNGKILAEEGYDISSISVDFEKSTGKILDEKFLGFSKIINLVKDCKDIAVIKEAKRGCHLASPVKPNE